MGEKDQFWEHGFYYAFDDRAQTCFSFDPRDDSQRPLVSFLPGLNETSDWPQDNESDGIISRQL